MDAMMEMGKLNTARIRKATDPRIMDVKRRVRQVRGLGGCLHLRSPFMFSAGLVRLRLTSL